MMSWRRCISAAAIGCLALVFSSPGTAASESLRPLLQGDSPGLAPSFAHVGDIKDSILQPKATERVVRMRQQAVWGGSYTASNGVVLRIFASDLYRIENEWLQSWAEWMSKYLYYRGEIATATFVFVTWEEMPYICGSGAAGCYSPSAGILVLPGNHHPAIHMATVLAHEYGHHVAVNRDNAPWFSGTWGPKRWASYTSVCERVQGGTAFPGDQGEKYILNPGEVYAETYALAVNRGGADWWPAWPWYFDASFAPDGLSLEFARQDALEPWAWPTQEVWNGELNRRVVKVKVKTKKDKFRTERRPAGPVVPAEMIITTSLDGVLTLTLDSYSGASLVLIDPGTGVVLAPPTQSSISYTVCGHRGFLARVVSRTPGDFQVTISTP